MDRHLKERMVGAAVLVAAAIILIPPMLSGPREAAPTGEPAPATDSGMKSYTIDLNAPKVREAEMPPEQPVEIAPAPQSDPVAPTPAQLAGEPSAQVSVQAAPQMPPAAQAVSAAAERSPPPERVAEKPVVNPAEQTAAKAAQKPVAKPAEKPVDTPADKPNDKPAPTPSGGWAVQVASFGVRATSERIADDLKAKGFSAYVTSFVAKEQTMYRVRVGPARDRESAEALLKKVKPLHPNATIVTQ